MMMINDDDDDDGWRNSSRRMEGFTSVNIDQKNLKDKLVSIVGIIH